MRGLRRNMAKLYDQICRILATSMPRSRALKLILGGIAGAVMAPFGFGQGQTCPTARVCQGVNGPLTNCCPVGQKCCPTSGTSPFCCPTAFTCCGNTCCNSQQHCVNNDHCEQNPTPRN